MRHRVTSHDHSLTSTDKRPKAVNKTGVTSLQSSCMYIAWVKPLSLDQILTHSNEMHVINRIKRIVFSTP